MEAALPLTLNGFEQEAASSSTVRQYWRVVPRVLIWLAALTAGFLLVLQLDEPVYRLFHEHFNYNKRPVPNHLRLATRVMRSMEDWGENVYILAVAFGMWRIDARRRSRLVCLFLSVILVSLAVEGVKRLAGRERPEKTGGKTVFHGPALWNVGGDVQSFPSGHTAAAAAYSGSLSAFYPPLRPIFVALAVGCGGNRIWKERHFLSDCLVGGLFGFWFAYTFPRRRWLQSVLTQLDQRMMPRMA